MLTSAFEEGKSGKPERVATAELSKPGRLCLDIIYPLLKSYEARTLLP
jgi:hypothetical protein